MILFMAGILVFVNPKTEEVNVLHRHVDGQLELLELSATVLYGQEADAVAFADGQ